MAGRTVLILGAGIAGIPLADLLRRRLAAEDRVILVDARAEHEFRPMLLPLSVGVADAPRLRHDLSALSGRGVDVVRGHIEAIDPRERAAVVDGRRLAADALVVALGADMDEGAIPGLSEGGCNLYRAEGADLAARRLAALENGRLVVAVAAGPYTCPLAPHEYALLADHHLRSRGVRGRVEISLSTADAGPMADVAPVIGDHVARWLTDRGVDYRVDRAPVSVEPREHLLHFADGTETGYDVLVTVPPHVPPPAVRDSALAGIHGWIPVDARTCETAFDNVFAIGDVAEIRVPSGRGLLPKQGVFAHAQARALVQTLSARLLGPGAPEEGRFDGEGEFFFEMGGEVAALICTHLYALPEPAVMIMHPAPQWHAARVAVAANWRRNYFAR